MLIYDLAFDVYPPDDPAGKVSGTGVAARLVRLTLDDQLIDGEYVAELFGTGSGFLEIHVDNPDADLLQKRGYVQVIRMTGSLWMAEEPIGGFWLDRGFLKALSGSEQVGRVVRWEGDGPSKALDRYVLGHSVYATGQTQRGDRTEPGKWAWNDEPMGAMLVRVLEEGFDHPAGFYNFFDWDFTRNEDSNGNDWDTLSDYETPIGTSGLKLWADFLKQGLVAEVLPDLTVTAYRRLSEYRTDRHSATFAANKVRFEAGVNITADLLKRLNADSQRTHVLYQDRIGDYETIDEDIDLNPIDGVPYMTFRKSTTTADDDTIRRMGRQFLTKLDQYVDVAKVKHTVGPGGIAGAEGYLPSPTGDYWLGDLVTIHSGTTDYDFNEQTIEVAAIRYFVQGNQWMVETELGAQYRSIQQENVQSQIAQTVINQILASVLLCQADATVDTESVSLARLYFSSTTSGLSAITPDAGWENTASGVTGKTLKTSPDSTYSGTHQTTNSVTGSAGGLDVLGWQGVYGPLSTAEAAAIAAGGLTFRSQIRSRMRYGVGISESAQDGISNESVRVTAGATTTIRGTALALHTAASSAGSAKWPANATKQNRQGPPAGVATRTLSAVPACVAGDYLVIEVGVRNYTTVTSGAAIALTNDSASDLPYDDFTTAAQNSYVDIYDPGTGTLVLGDGMAQLVGSSVKAKRCDDTEHYHAIGSASPTADDDREAGFRIGTLWVNDDGSAWLCIDNANGDADWIALAGGGGPDLSGIDFLVGTASGLLSSEIVVGTTPGGELGGTWSSPTVDAVHVDASHYQLNKLNGTTAPTVNDDSGDGYSVGSRWIDTTNDRVYTCTDATGGAAVWKEGFSIAGGPATISGGTETTTGGFHYCAFTSSGTLTVSSPGYVDVLVVGAGGGGGAYYSGGGGGAGDVVLIKQLFLSANQTIVVGAGGAGGTRTASGGDAADKWGSPGGPSLFGASIAAAGGGAGGGDSSVTAKDAKYSAGASSGGGGTRGTANPGPVIGGGESGGTSRTGTTAGTGAGGGGGGAGAVGANAGASDTGAAGGAGVSVTEFSGFGASGVFGGGGGGGGVSAGGAGGTGGGGHGGGTSANTGITAGTANTGGGGGGGGNTSTTGAVGQSGGSGVVLVRAAV